MKKHTSEEAYHERLKHLSGVQKTSVNESKNRNLGTLINYRRAADGVAYGIVKEQHHYYIKKGGLNENLNVADFAYIGGLSNLTEFQYTKISEADKQRNMLFNTINEGVTKKVSKTGSRKILTEDKAGQEIEMAASKLDDLDAATDAAEISTEPMNTDGEAEMDAGLDAMGDAPEGGEEELPAMGDAPEGDEEEVATEDPQDETTREIEKNLGRLTNTLRKTELTDSQVKSYVNSFLSAFKDKFTDIEIEDRKAMAEKITKVVPQEDIEDLGQNVEDTDGDGINLDNLDVDSEEVAEQESGFAQYAESRGFNADSIQECGSDEMTNLVSGFANAHADGENDGDFKVVALFITPEIIEKLKSEYGHDDFANQVEPFSTEMNETPEEDKTAQINELFGGLKNLGKGAVQGIKQGAQAAGQAIGQKAQQVGQAVGDAATNIKQTYHAGELGSEVKKLEKYAAQLGAQVKSLSDRMVKAGGQPINPNSILTTIKNQIGVGGAANLGKYGSVQEDDGIPSDHVQVQEDVTLKVGEKAGKKLAPTNVPVKEMKEAEEKEGDDVDFDALDVSGEEETINMETSPEEETPNLGMSAGFQSMGGGVVKPDGTPTTIEVTKDSVNVTMNESERKLRKYIRNRLEERVGIRKPSLNENKKSDIIKKLDKKIDEQFKSFKNKNIDEGFLSNIGSAMGLDKSLQVTIKNELPKYVSQNNVSAIDSLFKKTILRIPLNGRVKMMITNKPLTTEKKIEMLNQAAIDPKGIGSIGLTPDGNDVAYRELGKMNLSKGGPAQE